MAEQENKENQKQEEQFFDLNPGNELEQADADVLNEQTTPESHIVADKPESIDDPKDNPEATETAVETPVEPEVDDRGRDITSAEHFQSLNAQTENSLKAEREETQRLRQEIADSKQPEPLKEEVIPQRPNTDDPIDIQKYQGDMIEWQGKQMQKMAQQTLQEKQLREQAETNAQKKAYTLGQLQKHLNPDEANAALEYYSNIQSTEDEYYGDLAKYFLWKQGNKNSVRTVQIDKRSTRQNNVLPLGVVPAEEETKKVDDSTAFVDDIMKYNKQYL